MSYLFLLIYVMALGWWIKSTKSLNTPGLSRSFVCFIFLSKIIAGLIYGLIHYTYFKGGDTFIYLNESTLLGSTFLSHPTYYLGSLLGWDVIVPNAAVFTYPSSAIFWKDLGTYSLVHIHALLYPFTFGYYHLHIFFIAIIGLFASLNFYNVFRQILDLPKIALIVCCFFLPSLTFWTAGLHKDVYIYFGLSLFLLSLLEFQQKKQSFKTILNLCAAILVIGLIRHYLLVLLLPATLAYLSTLYYSKRIWTTYLMVYSLFIAFAFIVTKFVFGIELFDVLINQQTAFLAEKGGSSIQNVEPLSPTFLGILQTVPVAFVNVLGRPFLWECKDFLQFLASFEILSFLGLIVISLGLKKQSIQSPNILVPFIVAYTITNLLLVGLLVANIGTIARYRAISLGLLSALLTRIFAFHKAYQKETNHTNPNLSKIKSSPKKNINPPSFSKKNKAKLLQ
ncbi:MAG: hypothetical protein ACI976_002593 [Aureispira sp.]|jgi:hypothetical protein